jgi:hypothetical protein
MEPVQKPSRLYRRVHCGAIGMAILDKQSSFPGHRILFLDVNPSVMDREPRHPDLVSGSPLVVDDIDVRIPIPVLGYLHQRTIILPRAATRR